MRNAERGTRNTGWGFNAEALSTQRRRRDKIEKQGLRFGENIEED